MGRKKLMSLALILMCTVSMCACGNKGQTTLKPQETVEVAEKEENMQTSEDDTKEEEGTATKEEENKEEQIPKISVWSEQEQCFTEDDYYLLAEFKESFVKVENSGFSGLKAVLEEKYCGMDQDYKKNLVEDAQNHLQQLEEADTYNFNNYYAKEIIDVMKCDSNILSMRVCSADYSGGAHGMMFASGDNWDVQTGKELMLWDVVTDREGFVKDAVMYISKELYKEHGDDLEEDYKKRVRDGFGEEETTNWYLTSAGIHFIYNVYEVGPYTVGIPDVLLPFREFGKYLDPKYVNGQGGILAEIYTNTEFQELLGVNEKVYIETKDDAYDRLNVSLNYGTKKEEIGDFDHFEKGYLVRREDGRAFVIFTFDGMSDDYITFVYEITDGNIKKCDELSVAIINEEVIAGDKVGLTVRLDVLGTFMCPHIYNLDENGKLVQSEDKFTIKSQNQLEVIKELPVLIGDENTTLAPGSKIRITGTNNMDEAYFEIPKTGETGIIVYEMKEGDVYERLIDGVSEFEYFEMLYYVG